MLNIGPPSVSMLLEIEKLVLDEISDFTPNQGISLGPAPEGHRDPIAKLLSNRSKRNVSLIQIGNGESCDGDDFGEGEADDCDSEEENDENEDISCKSQKDYDIKVTSDGNGLRRRKGTKRLVHNNDNLANINNLINTDGVNLELSLDDISDDGCLSPCCHDCRSGLQSPVHIISGLNGESNRHIMASPELNKFLTHEPPDGCEKVNITKDIKKSFRPNQLSHVVLAPCPQKPCNPGFVLLPSQSSAFLPLTKITNDNLDNITNRLGNTDLGTSINKLG